MLQLSIQYSLQKRRQSVLQDTECSYPCEGCNLRLSLCSLSLLSNSWSSSLTQNNSTPGISPRSTGGGVIPGLHRGQKYKTILLVTTSRTQLLSLFPCSFFPIFHAVITAEEHLSSLLYLWLQSVLQRLLLQKAILIVSAGSSWSASCQPTWINLGQFLSAYPLSHSRV